MADDDEVRMVISADTTEFVGSMTAAGEAMSAAMKAGALSVEQADAIVAAFTPTTTVAADAVSILTERMTALTAATQVATAAQAEFNATQSVSVAQMLQVDDELAQGVGRTLGLAPKAAGSSDAASPTVGAEELGESSSTDILPGGGNSQKAEDTTKVTEATKELTAAEQAEAAYQAELKAQLAAYTAETNSGVAGNQKFSNSAREMGSAMGQGAANNQKFKDALASVNGDISKLTPELIESGGVIDKTEKAVNGFTAALNSNRTTTGLVTIMHEGLTNRWSRIPATLSILTQAVFGLSAGMTLLAVAGVGVVAGLGYLIYEAIETNREMTELGNAFASTGRGAEDAAGFAKDLNTELERMDKVSGKAREKLLEFYASNASITREQAFALDQLEGSLAKAFGDRSVGMVEQIQKHLETLTVSTLPALDREYGGLSSTQYRIIKDMLEMGNTAGAQAEFMKDRIANAGGAFTDIDTDIKNTQQHLDDLKDPSTRAKEALYSILTGNLTASWQAYNHELEVTAQHLKDLENAKPLSDAQNKEMRLKHLDDEATAEVKKDDPRGDDEKKLKDYAEQRVLAEEKLSVAKAQNNALDAKAAQEEIDLANAASKAVTAKIGKIDDSAQKKVDQDKIAQARDDVAQIQALQQGSREQQLSQEAAVWAKLLSDHRIGSEARKQIERSYYAAIAQMTNAGKEVHEAELRDAVQTAKAGSQERIAAAQAFLSYEISARGQESTQAKNAQKDVTEAVNSAAEERKKVAEKEIEDEIRGLDRKLAARIRELNEEAKAGEISKQRREQLEVEATQHTATVEADLYNQLIPLYDKDSEAYQAAEDKKVAAAQASADKITAIQDTMAADATKMFENMFHPFQSAMDSMVSGLMQGRQSFKDIAAGAIREMITQEIEAQIKVQTEKLALYAADAAGFKSTQAAKDAVADSSNSTLLGAAWKWLFGEKAVDAASTASKAASEAAKTGTTVGGTAARTGVVAGAAAAESAKDTATVGTKTATEAAKTTAVSTGAATRAAAETAGAAAQKIADTAVITEDAGVAAAGAYAATAGIPYVGPILAPGAAAEAFSAVMAFNVFHEGAWDLPQDQMGFLQKGESIVPATFASGMRSAISSSGGASGKGGGDETHLHMNYSPSISVGAGASMSRAEFSKLLVSHSGSMAGEVRNLMRKGQRF